MGHGLPSSPIAKRGGDAARPAVPTGIDRGNWRLRQADTGPTDHRLARTYRVCRPDLSGQPELPERPQPPLLREPRRASGSAGYRGLLPRPRARLLRVRSRRQARYESRGDLRWRLCRAGRGRPGAAGAHRCDLRPGRHRAMRSQLHGYPQPAPQEHDLSAGAARACRAGGQCRDPFT
jgi:hypothetical protein